MTERVRAARFCWIWRFAAAALLAGWAVAGESAAAPATTTARPAPDLSTPRAAMLAYNEVAYEGSLDDIRRVTTGTEDAYELLKARIDARPALAEMHAAIRDRFGDEGRQHVPDVRDREKARKYAAEAPVKINGDRANLGGNYLLRVNGEWRFDLSAYKTPAPFDARELNQARAQGPIARAIARRIRDGEFATAEEAIEEFDDAVSDAGTNPKAATRRAAASTTVPADAGAPELLVQLLDERGVSEKKRANINQRLLEMPPAQTIPAVVEAISRCPEDKKSRWQTPAQRTLCDLLSAIAKRGPRPAADRALVDAWPKAVTAFARWRLLLEYRDHQVADAEPIARAIYEDRKSDPGTRMWAARVLLSIGHDRWREPILLELDRDPTWGWMILDAFLDSRGRRPIDPLVVCITIRRIREPNADTDEGRLSVAGNLANALGIYTGERNGLPNAARAALDPLAKRMPVENYYKAEIKRCLDWWEKNKERFEPEAQKRRAAATRPATEPGTR